MLKLEPVGNPWEPGYCSVSIIETKDSKSKNYKEEIGKGLDFLLLHLNQERLFPRTIQTRKSKGSQIEVFSKEEALNHFQESNFIDCRVNAFPSDTRYKEVQRYPPDFIFIDLDRSNFESDKQFEKALSKTLKNIKEKLNGYPTVNNSGNGYHVIQPIECPILEQIPEFEKYEDKGFFLSQEFLRFAENNLSNGKADLGHYPSFKSCQIRVPNSINGKCLDNRDKRLSGDLRVKTLYRWNEDRPLITREFIEDFRTHLEQKITDQENNNYNYNYERNNNYSNQNHSNNNRIEWIEKLLQTPITEYRKRAVDLILVPYFILVKKLSIEETTQKIMEWLQKGDSLSGRRLDFDPRQKIREALKNTNKKQIGPMRYNTLKEKYKDLYLLLQDHNNNNNNNSMIK